jgi:menaquinol-cytochrome c reductase iron-sulfur subunit
MNNSHTPLRPRRKFVQAALAIITGTVSVLVPIGAGLLTFFDPLRRKSAKGDAIRVTTLNALPADGVPRKFPVLATRTDAWNKFTNVPVGAVYLRRTSENTIEALNVICPHAGCFVDFVADRKSFLCPCHDSTFAIDGKINDPKSPSPRGLDPLKVEIRKGEVYVTFMNFRAGTADRIPEA